jgi:hypothetical protein
VRRDRPEPPAEPGWLRLTGYSREDLEVEGLSSNAIDHATGHCGGLKDCQRCRDYLASNGHHPEILEGDESSSYLPSDQLDGAPGMLLSELLSDDGDDRSVEEVLENIDEVLDEENNERCCKGDWMCSRHYDLESEGIADSWIRDKTSHPLVREWTVRGFVNYRAEVWNSDQAVKGEQEWFEEHGLDAVEQRHMDLICPDDCPVCLPTSYYLDRISRSLLLGGTDPFSDTPQMALFETDDGMA